MQRPSCAGTSLCSLTVSLNLTLKQTVQPALFVGHVSEALLHPEAGRDDTAEGKSVAGAKIGWL